MVLYCCCVSSDHARLIEKDGFEESDLVRVSDCLSDMSGRSANESNAVIFLAAQFDFDLDAFPLVEERDSRERLVPGRILNALPRGIWPDA